GSLCHDPTPQMFNLSWRGAIEAALLVATLFVPELALGEGILLEEGAAAAETEAGVAEAGLAFQMLLLRAGLRRRSMTSRRVSPATRKTVRCSRTVRVCFPRRGLA